MTAAHDTGAAVIAAVDAVRARPARRGELIALLDEAHPVYQDRSAALVVQLRGWVLQAFGEVGLPAAARAHVLEELESSHEPYLVAAAARALRGWESPSREAAALVVAAMTRLRLSDDRVGFARFGETTARDGATMLEELAITLAGMGAAARAVRPAVEALRADPERVLAPGVRARLDALLAGWDRTADAGCCGADADDERTLAIPAGRRRSSAPVDAVELEDHAGRIARFDRVFHGQVSLVAFFYTRCPNPRRCSLTVTRLAALQRRLDRAGLAARVRLAAVTYDPGYDTPARLRRFAETRGLRLDDRHVALRTTGGIAPLRSWFGLGAGFVASLVNRHRVELYLLDERGRIAGSFTRLAWRDDEVMARVRALLDEPAAPRPARIAGRTALAALPPVALALFPKCPMCWAAYLGALGVAGLERIPYLPWLVPVFIALMVLNVAVAWRRSTPRAGRAGFVLTAAGAAAVLGLGRGLALPYAVPSGIALLVAGALLGTLVTVTRRPRLR